MANELGSHGPVVLERADSYTKLAAVLIGLLAAWFFYLKGRKLRLPPGPFAWPIIGNLHLLGQLPHKTLAALSLKYGPLMSLRLGSALTLVVSSPDVAKEFLKNNDRVFASRPSSAATKCLLYDSADVGFAPYGAHWRELRKICTLQLLSSRRIESFSCSRQEDVSEMIRSITNSVGRPISVTKSVSALSYNMICRMVLGKKCSDQSLSESTAIISMLKETLLFLGSFNIGDYIPYLSWMDFQGFNRRLRNFHKGADELLEKIVEEHISQNKPNVLPDFVDVLLAACKDEAIKFQITREHIKGVIYV